MSWQVFHALGISPLRPLQRSWSWLRNLKLLRYISLVVSATETSKRLHPESFRLSKLTSLQTKAAL